MAYSAHNYQSGARLYASQLNEMDAELVKLDGITETIQLNNRYNPASEQAGYIIGVNGALEAHASYTTDTDYIPAVTGQYISCYGANTANKNGVAWINWYDSSKTWLGRQSQQYGAVRNVKIELANVAYARVVVWRNSTNVAFYVNDTNPNYTILPYSPYGAPDDVRILESALPDSVADTLESVADINTRVDAAETLLDAVAVAGTAGSANVYNPAKEKAGYVLSSTGVETANGSYALNEDYIPCAYGQYVSCYGGSSTEKKGVAFIGWYDSAKNWLGRESEQYGTVRNVKAAITGTAYIRVVKWQTNPMDIAVYINDTNPNYTELPYVPYAEATDSKLKYTAFPDEYGTEIAGIKSRVSALETGLPSYIADEVTLKVGESLEYDGKLSFIWCSDIHVSGLRQDFRPLDAVNACAKSGSFDFVCLGGDIVDGAVTVDGVNETKTEALEWMRKCMDRVRDCGTVFAIMGNHERNFNGYNFASDPTEVFQNRDMYRMMVKRNIGDIVTNPLETYPLYWYKDFPHAKVRVICINSSDNVDDDGTVYGHPVDSTMRQRQFTWLQNVALNFMDKGTDRSNWAVLTLGHAGLIVSEAYGLVGDMTTLKLTMKAFRDGTAYSGVSSEGEWYERRASVDFTEQGPIEYIGHIQGHIHYDGVVNSYGMGTTPGIYVCNAYCGKKSGATGPFSAPDRNTSDVTSQLFDLITVDRTAKKIHMVRFGAGSDRHIGY